MGSSGKTTQSTQQVQIPPDVLARYNAVNAQAQQAASQPFTPYTGEFVAPVNATQAQGINQTAAASTQAQPYYGAAAGMTLGAAFNGPGQLTSGQINQYMNPFTNAVIAPTVQALQQQQGQQLAQQQAQAVQSGGFGDRAQLARAQLQGQQLLGLGQAISPLYQQNYQQAVSTATGQQQLGLQEQQQQLAAAQQLAGIGTAAQTAGLTGAQALTSAGTLQQQTQQAQDTAQYQQFLQQQGYPFQTAQFLANIAEGTGALSGSTTTATQQAPFFSDRRLKENIIKIGKTNDGLGIYKYNYKNDNQKQIGLMADEVEEKHPEAVGLAGGYKTVNYDEATKDSERTAKRYGGGLDLSWMGGAVHDTGDREHFAYGGAEFDPYMASYLQQQRQFLPGIGGQSYATAQGAPGSSATAQRVPQANVPVNLRGLNVPSMKMTQPETGLKTTLGDIEEAKKVSSAVMDTKSGLDKAVQWASNMQHSASIPSSLKGEPPAPTSASSPPADMPQPEMKQDYSETAYGGARTGLAAGGVDPYKPVDTSGGLGSIIEGDEESQEKPKQLQSGSATTSKPDTLMGDIGGVASMIGAGKTLAGLGSSAMSGLSSLLPMLAFKEGGLVDRHGYDKGGPAPNPGLGDDGSDTDTGITPRDRDLAIRTIAAETSGDPDETLGIASVINNRFKTGNYKSYGDVVTAPNQFEPWNNPKGNNYPMKIDPNSDRYQMASDAFDKARAGSDPTGGATHFWAPDAQAALGREPPSWATYNGPRIGGTQFEKLDDTGAPAPRPKVDLGQATSEPTTYGGTPARYASLGDVMSDVLPSSVPTSSSFWVPALSGIGSMLASRSPFLGVALGEGLVGGVSGYQAQQRQNAELAKQVMDMVNSRFIETTDNSGNVVFHNKMTGTTASPADVQTAAAGMFRSLGLDPRAYGIDPSISAAAGTTKIAQIANKPQAGATTAPAPKTQPSAAPPKSVDDMNYGELREYFRQNPQAAGLTGQDDLNYIQNRIQGFKNLGDTTQAFQEQQRYDKLLDNAVKLQGTKNEEMLKGNVEAYQNYQKDAAERGSQFSQQMANWDRLAQIYSEYEPGRADKAKTELWSWAQSMGLPVTQDQVVGANNFDEAMKLVTDQAVKELRESKLVRAPASSMKSINLTIPTPTTNPGAVYNLIGNAKAALQYSLDKDKNFYDEVPKGANPSQWQTLYEQNHPHAYEKTLASSFNTMPEIKGVPPDVIKRNYTLYGQYGYKIPGSTEAQTESTPPVSASEGQESVSKSGKPIVFRNGNWEYK